MAQKYKKRKNSKIQKRYRKTRRTLRKWIRLLLPLLFALLFLLYQQTDLLPSLPSSATTWFSTVLTRAGFEEAAQWVDKIARLHPSSSGNQDALSPSGPLPTGSSDFEVHFLDVGQGLSVLILSNGHAMLYDGGDRSTSSFVVAYLKKQGVTSLDYVIASHYDSDHINGVIGALHVFPTSMVIGPDYVHNSKTYTSFINAVTESGNTVTHPARGTIYPFADSYFTILAPETITSDPNQNSVAIRLVNGSNSFVITGDADLESEEAMCYSGLKLSCDVLCVGHHGSSTSTGNTFLNCTAPTWAVISVGAGNDYGHPHAETLKRLKNYGVKVLRTDQLGTIIAKSNKKEITWETERAASSTPSAYLKRDARQLC